MTKATQLCVAMDNKPGALAKLCGCLKRAKVNIIGISVTDNADCGWARLVASSPTAARRALKDAGYSFVTRRVIVVRPINRAGELERISRTLARAGVNIQYVYGTSGIASSSTLILGVSDVDAAAAALA
ncbi:MAG: hypothetical protein IID31_00935 [Planctomycetes bacterium]|nr:hypothetical protein [Planctomycetota bacterium]